MAEITLDTLIAELKDMIPALQHHGGYFPYDKYNDMGKYEQWLADTKRFLNINFPDDKFVVEFEETSKMKLCLEQQQKLLALLKAIADQPAIVPQEKKKEKGMGINLTANFNNTNSQTQSQEQSVAVDLFREAIKDELVGKQIKELKKITSVS